MEGNAKVELVDGRMVNGKFEGKVKVTYEDGREYDGVLKGDEPDGLGIMRWPDGHKYREYEGGWKDGKFHDKGKMKFANGYEYEGEYREGSREGKGIGKCADGRVCEGQWKRGKMDGPGKQTWPDGCVYEGQWKGDKRDGTGKYTFVDGRVYEGQWKDDKPRGKGEFKWPDGRVHDGEFKDGKMHGNGTFTDKNKDVYEGHWENSKRHGAFTLTESGGDVFKLVYNQGNRLSCKRCATLINGPRCPTSRTDKAFDVAVLGDDCKICSVCCREFATDMRSLDESIRKRLPVVSGKCFHWYCLECILDCQEAQAKDNNGIAPDWIKCFRCRREGAFRPSEPNFYWFLINLLNNSIPVVGGEQPEDTSRVE